MIFLMRGGSQKWVRMKEEEEEEKKR